MVTKPFDRNLYEENNQLAVRALSELLEQRRCTVLIPDKEQFKSHDFEFIDPAGGRHKIEVERKKVWKKSCQWEGWITVDVPYRKVHSNADYFGMVNLVGDSILMIPMKKVLESPVREKDTIYTAGEKFFKVPVSEFTMYIKKGGTWC